ncbi:hypothetical protein [Pontibacter amylolyticus]|uniref:Uncharacterized protein n=1 Tax=Pontibacter amylolyticus TaxID=1424080 RepID=A0ABQ1W4Y0_9BACT|nr:hypothetical protein [Pontibacter amylolyticus]GGG11572.1 hypothetical protein GCM10011323_15080 [Pontibacter amylolyticus]
MKIIILLLALVASFGFALKKTIDERVLLAEHLQQERVTLLYSTQNPASQPVAML